MFVCHPPSFVTPHSQEQQIRLNSTGIFKHNSLDRMHIKCRTDFQPNSSHHILDREQQADKEALVQSQEEKDRRGRVSGRLGKAQTTDIFFLIVEILLWNEPN